MNLEVFSPAEAKIWNDIVYNSVNGTLFHTWEWLSVVVKNSDYKLVPLVFFDSGDDKPFSAIPLFYRKTLGFKMVFSPPPSTGIPLGPLILEKGYLQHKFELAYLEFERQLNKYFKDLGVNYVNIVTSPGLLDMRPFEWDRYQVAPIYTYKIDLGQGEKVIWGNFSRTLKQNIDHSLSKGIRIIESQLAGSGDINYLYDSLKERYLEQHINFPIPRQYLLDVEQEFGTSALKLLLAQFEGDTVGAILFTKYKKTISAWMGSARSKTNGLDVNGCIYREIIIASIKDGFKWLEMIGANTPQLCSAKARYSPEVDIHFQIKKAGRLGALAEKVYAFKKHYLNN